jgi:sodium-dependent dicarboxylate transporter 2/3/5
MQPSTIGTTVQPQSKNVDTKKRQILYMVIALIIGAITLYFAPATGLDVAGQRLLAILMFIVVVWATEAVAYPVSALMLIMLMMWAGAVGKGTYNSALKEALSGFSSQTPMAVLCATAFAVIVEKTGLSERVVYRILKLVSGGQIAVKAKRLLAALFFVEIPLSLMVPSATGRSALYVSIAEGLAKPFKFIKLDEAAKDEQGNPFQKAVYIVAAIMPVIMGAAFLTGAEATMLAGRLISDATKHQQYWLDTAIYLFFPALLLMLCLYLILVKVFPSSVDNIPLTFINERLVALGPMKKDEKTVLAVLIGAILLWITDSIHHIPAEAVLILVAVVLFCPGIGPGNWKKDGKALAWGSFLVIAVSLSFATMLSKYGVMKLIATWLSGAGVTNFAAFMFMVSVTLIIMRIAVASNTGATAIFVPLALELGQVAGMATPQIIALAWITYVFCRAGHLFPQQSAQVLLTYEFGFYSRKDLLKVGIPITLATLVIYMVWGTTVMPVIIR